MDRPPCGKKFFRTNRKNASTRQVNEEIRNVAWQIVDNKRTVLTTTLANLIFACVNVLIRLNPECVQTWLLVRMPEPPPMTPIPVSTK